MFIQLKHVIFLQTFPPFLHQIPNGPHLSHTTYPQESAVQITPTGRRFSKSEAASVPWRVQSSEFVGPLEAVLGSQPTPLED